MKHFFLLLFTVCSARAAFGADRELNACAIFSHNTPFCLGVVVLAGCIEVYGQKQNSVLDRGKRARADKRLLHWICSEVLCMQIQLYEWGS